MLSKGYKNNRLWGTAMDIGSCRYNIVPELSGPPQAVACPSLASKAWVGVGFVETLPQKNKTKEGRKRKRRRERKRKGTGSLSPTGNGEGSCGYVGLTRVWCWVAMPPKISEAFLPLFTRP